MTCFEAEWCACSIFIFFFSKNALLEKAKICKYSPSGYFHYLSSDCCHKHIYNLLNALLHVIKTVLLCVSCLPGSKECHITYPGIPGQLLYVTAYIRMYQSECTWTDSEAKGHSIKGTRLILKKLVFQPWFCLYRNLDEWLQFSGLNWTNSFTEQTWWDLLCVQMLIYELGIDT